jgi:hypothetical protein
VIEAANTGSAPKVMPSPMNEMEAAVQAVRYGRPSGTLPSRGTRLMKR